MTTVRDRLKTHAPRLLAGATCVPVHAAYGAALYEVGHEIVCACGSDAFRVLGVPVAMAGAKRGYVLRAMLRVWRELQAVTTEGEDGPGRLSPPLRLDCARCGARTLLLAAQDADRGGTPPLEALRCRPCRSSSFSVAVLCAHREAELDAEAVGGEEECYDAWRLAVRCRACGALGEPFGRVLRSERERRIDRLYGRAPRRADDVDEDAEEAE